MKVIAAVLAVLFIVYLGAVFRSQSNDYLCPECNIILVSVDTLRPDHLGCYGYDKNTSPNIDLFCEDSVVFKTAIAQAPSTAPSHASIFTSLIPSSHGAFFSRKAPIAEDVPTIAELLKSTGFQTVSYNGGGQIVATFGFSRGFDLYQSYSEGDYTREFFVDRVKESIEWMEKNKERKFFLFLHSYEVHHPYSPAEEFLDDFAKSYKGSLPRNVRGPLLRAINRGVVKANQEDRDYVKALYDAEIRSMDKGFGELVEYLKSSGLYDNSLIIFTSDHGEEFDEHGSIGWHSHTLYDELLKVPLMIKFPGSSFAGKKISDQVRGIDITPTILDVIEQPILEHFQGASLLPLVRGEGKFDKFAVSQKDSRRPVPGSALRTNEWKLINHRLYDLENDPTEQNNVADDNPSIYESFRNMLERLIARDRKEALDQFEIDPATLEQLRTLGYLD